MTCKKKIFYDGENLYKEYVIEYYIDNFNYNTNIILYFEYNIKEISIENIQENYTYLIDFFKDKNLQDYEISLSNLIKKCLLSFEKRN